MSIALGKISVAFLIERIAGPCNWRKWLLRSISISVFISAVITIMLFYVQCQPARALWDKGMLKEGTGKCWNPIPVNTWDLVIASYWAFLDFALAFIPVDMVWKLHLSVQKKLWLSGLLSMGVFAGICAAVKTSKVPITVDKTEDITWATIALLMWNGIEMNVIIVAACIPTLRPIFLILFKRPGAAHFHTTLNERSHTSYPRTSDSNNQSSATTASTITNKVTEKPKVVSSTASSKPMTSKISIYVNDTIEVESSEVDSDEIEWVHMNDPGVSLSKIGRALPEDVER
ncbi:hypothetical protein MMC28_009831 [Mycoblastus sanguinarius]|nr:hypothetical protein [Mycoblastus sanguinarius]